MEVAFTTFCSATERHLADRWNITPRSLVILYLIPFELLGELFLMRLIFNELFYLPFFLLFPSLTRQIRVDLEVITFEE